MATVEADVRISPPTFIASATLDDGDMVTITPGEQAIDRAEVVNIAHGGDCTVRLLHDANGDGSYNRSVELDTLSGSGVSQGNEITLNPSGMRLEVEDTSGGTDNDYIITGEDL